MTKDRTSTEFLCLTISAGAGKREQAQDIRGYRRRYRIGVQSDATGARIFFDFTGSVADEAAGVTTLDRQALLWAFRCFVEDGISGDQPFADFAADFGYDLDSYSARRTWEACKSSARKFGRLFSSTSVDAGYVLDQLTAEGVE